MHHKGARPSAQSRTPTGYGLEEFLYRADRSVVPITSLGCRTMNGLLVPDGAVDSGVNYTEMAFWHATQDGLACQRAHLEYVAIMSALRIPRPLKGRDQAV